MTYRYLTSGVCAKEIDIEISGNRIVDVKFLGGCPGHRQAVSALVRGKRPADVAGILRGIDCGGRGTSCADQLARCLDAIRGQGKKRAGNQDNK